MSQLIIVCLLLLCCYSINSMPPPRAPCPPAAHTPHPPPPPPPLPPPAMHTHLRSAHPPTPPFTMSTAHPQPIRPPPPVSVVVALQCRSSPKVPQVPNTHNKPPHARAFPRAPAHRDVPSAPRGGCVKHYAYTATAHQARECRHFALLAYSDPSSF